MKNKGWEGKMSSIVMHKFNYPIPRGGALNPLVGLKRLTLRVLRNLSLAGCLLGFGLTPSLIATEKPANIAIIDLTCENKQAIDLLTVELAQQKDFITLERSEIDKVLKEHEIALSNSTTNYLKIAKLLKADGLILINKLKIKNREILLSRLVAVNPGVIIASMPYPLPLKDIDEWCNSIKKRFIPLFPKLQVKRSDAIPLSILNIRSSVDTPQAMLLEKELTLRLIHRAIREKDIFVLERWGMDKLDWEKKLTADEAHFWTGSYMVDGTFDLEKDNQIKIKLRIREPDKKEKWIEVASKLSELSSLIDSLMPKLMKSINKSSESLAWKPKEEGEEYFKEARWAYNADLYDVAISAIESAWALGYQEEDAINLRVKSYYCYAYPDKRAFYRLKYNSNLIDIKNLEEHIYAAIKSLTIFNHFILKKENQKTKREKISRRQAVMNLEDKIILNASFVIRICRDSGKTKQYKKQLFELRKVIQEVEQETFKNEYFPPYQVFAIKAKYIPLWYDNPKDTLKKYHQMLTYSFHKGYFEGFRKSLFPRYRDNIPLLIDWNNPINNAEVDNLWFDFINKLSKSNDLIDQVNGLFLKIKYLQLKNKPSIKEQKRLLNLLWEYREKIFFTNEYAYRKTLLFTLFTPPFPSKQFNEFLFNITEYGIQRLMKDPGDHNKGQKIKRRSSGPPRTFFDVFKYWIQKEKKTTKIKKMFDLYQNYRKECHTDKTMERWIYAQYEKIFYKYIPKYYTTANMRKSSSKTHAIKGYNLKPTNKINNFWTPAIFSYTNLELKGIFNRKNQIWTLFSSSNGYILFMTDLEKNISKTIKLPSKFKGYSKESHRRRTISVNNNYIVVVDTQNNIFYYNRKNKDWKKTDLPNHYYTAIEVCDGNLYAAFSPYPLRLQKTKIHNSGIFKLNLQNGQIELFADSRRNPSKTPLDNINIYHVIHMCSWDNKHLIITVKKRHEARALSSNPEKMFLFSLENSTWKHISTISRAAIVRKKVPKGLFIYGFSGCYSNYCFILDPLTGKKIPIFGNKIKNSLNFSFHSTGLVCYYNGPIYFVFGREHRTNMMYSLRQYSSPKEPPLVIPLKFEFNEKDKKMIFNSTYISKKKIFEIDAIQGHFPGTPRAITTDKFIILFAKNAPGFWYVPIKEIDDAMKKVKNK